VAQDGLRRRLAGQTGRDRLTDCTRPQIGRVGIKAENELRAALGNPRGERIPETRRRGQRLFTALLRPLPAVNLGTLDAAI
jgi:hypothetical protein